MVTFILVLSIACIVICHLIAKKRALNPVFWGAMGAIFGPLAIPFVAFIAKPGKSL